MESIKSNFSNNFQNGLNEICNFYTNKIDVLEKQLGIQNITIEHLQSRISSIEQQHDILKDDFEQYKSVSIVKNLNKQISEKDNEISFLNKRINKLKTVVVNSSEETENTEVENTEVENTEVENTEVKNTEVENTAVENTEIENTEIENTEIENTETESSEEEVETTFIEKKLKGKIFFVSEDEDKEIYEKLPNGELGDIVGKYNNNNRPIFFKSK